MPERTTSLLLTDLYEITMAAAFWTNQFNPTATFELFVRRLPKNRGYLIAAGLEQALAWIRDARFSDEDIQFLCRHPSFVHVSDDFFEYLREFRFTGDIWAVPEGTLVFAEEPLVRVTAPIIEAQLLETYVLTAITFPTSIATKASRVVAAAQGKDVIEFGARRAHGPGAAVAAARAAYIGGCIGTSNVEAGYEFDIPTFGTMAHSYVMAMEDEILSFKRYADLFPETSVLLIDTYDTIRAVEKIIDAGLKPTGVRLDSGDLAQLSKEVRARLDAAGMQTTKILLSGDLDEFKIVELLSQGTPVDSFGVGTSLVTSNDAPALGGVYKLVEVESGTKKSYLAKFSAEKATYPSSKQVYRFRDVHGMYARDLIACSDEDVEAGELLLQQVMRGGRMLAAPPSLHEIRERVRSQLEALQPAVRRLSNPAVYDVSFSAQLHKLQDEARREHLVKAQ